MARPPGPQPGDGRAPSPDRGHRARGGGGGCGTSRQWLRRGLLAVALLALLLPSIASGDLVSLGAVAAGGSGAPGAAGTVVPVNLTVSPSGFHVSPTLWGTTVTSRAHLLPNEADLVNATPARVVLWPGGHAGDAYDPFNNTLLTTNGTQLIWSNASTSEAQFVAWCRSIGCQAIMQVPGEIDNASFGAAVVNYTENTLGFHPIAWEIGNEPEIWKEWGRPWSEWNQPLQLGKNRVTPSQYAWEVTNYSTAMRKVDPSLQIDGLAGTGRPYDLLGMGDWVNATVAIAGRDITGVSIHIYPAGTRGDVDTLTSFYATINSEWGLPNRVETARSDISNEENLTCPDCPPISVDITELGSALSHGLYGEFGSSFPGALDMAAQVVQGIDLNLTTMDQFSAVENTSNSWFTFDGSPRATYTLYSEILSHLGPVAYPVAIQTPPGPLYNGSNASLDQNLYGIATTAPSQGSRADLMLVNVNMTTGVSLAPSLPGIAPGTPAELYEWQGQVINGTTVVPATVQPVAQFFPNGLPSHWTLPPQTVALFEAYPGGAAPVTLNEAGLPPGVRWFYTIGSTEGVSNGTTATVLLPPGRETLSVPDLDLPRDRAVAHPDERYGAFAPSSFAVGGAPLSLSVTFALQWALSLSVTPAAGGTATPGTGWLNASSPSNLRAVAAPGYAFSRWTGYGGGSVNSTSEQISVDPTGPLSERAHFLSASSVSFVETGLPTGAPWTVSMENSTATSNGPSLTFWEPNGTHGFSVGTVPGYRSVPRNSSVNVSGAAVVVPVTFYRLHTPPSTYTVAFSESGLPEGAVWSVAVRGIPRVSNTSVIAFSEPNGTWGFSVGTVPGYRSLPRNSSVQVFGRSVVVEVEFVALRPPPPEYPVDFLETGLPGGTSWSVTMRNSTQASTSGTLAFSASNGTWGFSVGQISGYRSLPKNSSVQVAGGSATVAVTFYPLHRPPTNFTVAFSESGLPNGTSWDVAVRGVAQTTTSGVIGFSEPNGTWGFSVGTVLGYHVSPRNSSVHVAGSAVVVPVTFVPVRGPPPTYLVAFSETGLPAGTSWSVTMRNQTLASVAPTITFQEVNGTRGFSIGVVAGYRSSPRNSSVNVTGGPVAVPVVFTARRGPPTNYTVDFAELGLPEDTYWTLSVRGVPRTSNLATIPFAEPNGTWGFSVGSVPGYRSSPRNSSVTVAGSSTVVWVVFTPATPPVPSYAVEFLEAGLPVGTTWNISMRGVTTSANGPAIFVEQANGTWWYSVSAGPDFRASPRASTVTVAGAGSEVAIGFTPLHPPPPAFLVSFNETGLPAGTSWSVQVRGAEASSSVETLDFREPNGSYGFMVRTLPGYEARPPSGGFSVAGGPLRVPIEFVPIRTSFPVAWNETGLWANVSWWVTVDGVRYTAPGSWDKVNLTTGLHTFVVGDAGGFVPTPRSGTFSVEGLGTYLSVTFVLSSFRVQVVGMGLPSNASWRIRLSDSTTLVSGSSAAFFEPNGTYTWDAQAPVGYHAQTSHGNLTVQAASMVLTLQFVQNGPGPRPSALSLLLLAGGVGGTIGLGAVGTFYLTALLHRAASRRPRPAGRA